MTEDTETVPLEQRIDRLEKAIEELRITLDEISERERIYMLRVDALLTRLKGQSDAP